MAMSRPYLSVLAHKMMIRTVCTDIVAYENQSPEAMAWPCILISTMFYFLNHASIQVYNAIIHSSSATKSDNPSDIADIIVRISHVKREVSKQLLPHQTNERQ